MGTVNDFKEKGVVGALSDAVLDARDMAVDGAGMLWDGVQQLVGDDDMLQDACLRCEGAPQAGGTFPLEFADGRILEATVVQVDGVSDPPRAVCTVPGFEGPVLVPVLAPGVELPKADEAAEGEGNGFIDGLKQEWNATVQDFREKGAVGALKDATMDAVDIVGSTAKAGVDGARSVTNDLIDLDWSKETEKASNFVSSVSEKVAQHAEKVPVPKAMTENASWLVDSVKNEISATVQDFKEKGAVGAMKDAVLDAGDLVYTGATTAVEGAKSVAAPLAEQLPDLWSAENAAGMRPRRSPRPLRLRPRPRARRPRARRRSRRRRRRQRRSPRAPSRRPRRWRPSPWSRSRRPRWTRSAATPPTPTSPRLAASPWSP